MDEVPHFTSASRWVSEHGDERIYVTDYETTAENMDTAVAEMRRPERAEINAEFYTWRDRSITLHESFRLTERLHIP
jgi:hypothetical protein